MSRRRWIWTLAVLLGVLVFLLLAPALWRDPFPEGYSLMARDRHGEFIGARVAADGQWRFPPSDSVPVRFAQCLLEAEDRRFRFHPGVDPIAVVRALRHDIKAHAWVEGGSTITQQLARLSRRIRLGPRPRSFQEKIMEVLDALGYEIRWSKRTLLGMYASQAPFGANVVGVEAASWRWFGKDASRLSWAQAALLACLPNRPARLHPAGDREGLRRQRNRLLRHLRAHGLMDDESLALALAEPLPPAPLPLPDLAPHLLNGLAQRYPRGGNVNLTLDAALQRQAMDLARAHRQVLAQLDVRGLAIVGLAPGSDGRPEARIYIGNTEGSDPIGGQVDAVLAERSPGSALKPFLYGFAIDQGELLPKQWLEDIPTRFGDFSPENATSSYEGAVAADEALCRSLNVPFVRLLRTVGVSPFLDQLHRMGFHHLNYSADHYGLSLILGGGEVTLDELTSAYASLLPQVSPGPTRVSYGVASGTRIGFGASDENFLPGGATAFPVSTAARRAILNALSLPLRTEEEAWRTALAPDRPLAWKTGTSFGQRDAWAIGLTPRFCAGVWAGNPSGEGRAGLWGARSAAPLLFRILNLMEAVDRSPGPTSFQSPDTGARVEICALTGFRAGPNCPKREKVLAPSAGATAPVCPWHRRIQVTRDGHYRVRPNCAGTEISHDTVVLNLPGSIAAYLRQRSGDVALSPPWAHGCDAGEEREALEILYPDPGAILHTGRGFNGKRQHVVFEAGHRDPKAVLHWFLDGIYLGETTRFHTQSAEVETGSHALVVSDEEGRTAGVEFTVGKGI